MEKVHPNLPKLRMISKSLYSRCLYLDVPANFSRMCAQRGACCTDTDYIDALQVPDPIIVRLTVE